MFNYDYITKESTKENSSNQPQIPEHRYRILTVGCSGSAKKKALIDLISQQADIDKIILHAKDPYEAKYQFQISKRKGTGIKHLNDSEAFTEYSNNKDDICRKY